LDGEPIVGELAEPIPRLSLADHCHEPSPCLGEVRLPLGGPYRPRAHLRRLPDGSLRWSVRLWEVDRPVERLVPTDVLCTFARVNGLECLVAEIEAVVRRSSANDGP
jgi:hypothetical protein